MLSYYVSLRTEFRAVMPVTNSAKKRWSVRLYLQLFVGDFMSYLRYFCVCLRTVVSNIYCVVLCLSSYCEPYIVSFSRLSIFHCPSVFSNVYLLILPVIQKLFVNITYFYITYVYCRIIYNLFVRALETGRKVSANFIFTDNVRIYTILVHCRSI